MQAVEPDLFTLQLLLHKKHSKIEHCALMLEKSRRCKHGPHVSNKPVVQVGVGVWE